MQCSSCKEIQKQEKMQPNQIYGFSNIYIKFNNVVGKYISIYIKHYKIIIDDNLVLDLRSF